VHFGTSKRGIMEGKKERVGQESEKNVPLSIDMSINEAIVGNIPPFRYSQPPCYARRPPHLFFFLYN
jgi:hypothetical protein